MAISQIFNINPMLVKLKLLHANQMENLLIGGAHNKSLDSSSTTKEGAGTTASNN
jgi:hypothetical protein